MLEVAIMIEGQNGLNWPRWQRLAQAVEDLGFAGLYRSDHYTNANPPDLDSLELWVSLTWLASHTHRIEFGQLVTPVSAPPVARDDPPPSTIAGLMATYFSSTMSCAKLSLSSSFSIAWPPYLMTKVLL